MTPRRRLRECSSGPLACSLRPLPSPSSRLPVDHALYRLGMVRQGPTHACEGRGRHVRALSCQSVKDWAIRDVVPSGSGDRTSCRHPLCVRHVRSGPRAPCPVNVRNVRLSKKCPVCQGAGHRHRSGIARRDRLEPLLGRGLPARAGVGAGPRNRGEAAWLGQASD